MLVEFSVGNYKSFKDIQTLHLQAGNLKSKDGRLEESNTFQANDKFRLLKSKLIYGANDSGKSNLIRAMIAMFMTIENSFKDDQIIANYIEPFFLSKETIQQPTYFQLSLILEGIPYRYGMELKDGKVVSEWLFGTPDSKESYYFIREEMSVKVNKRLFKEALKIVPEEEDDVPIYAETSLFLSVAAASKRQIANKIVQFLQKKIGILEGFSIEFMRKEAMRLIDNEAFNVRLVQLLANIDINVDSIYKKNVSLIDHDREKRIAESSESKQESIFLIKTVTPPNSDTSISAAFNLDIHEAEGTKKIIELAPFLLVALEKGMTLILDELDARLHPRLTRKIVELFNSKETNPNNAQLIAVTHDTNLMDANLLRRDQICFVDRDENRSSFIYSLAEYKGVRNDAPFEKDYLKGKYGAVPFVNRVDDLFIHQTATDDA
jgi:AAA15 family ATPase/GTPase